MKALKNRLFARKSGKVGVMFLCLLLLVAVSAPAQSHHLRYAIHRGEDKVGELTFRQTTEGTQTTYLIESQVKVSLLLSITVQAWEKSVFENNVLQSSSLLRKVNGRERTNKQITKTGNGLHITNKNQKSLTKNFLVKYSSHCLYTKEPHSFTNVFSDNYQQFIPIQKMADHHYKIRFPDGGSNEYYYENGICKRINVKSALFDAEFRLVTP